MYEVVRKVDDFPCTPRPTSRKSLQPYMGEEWKRVKKNAEHRTAARNIPTDGIRGK